MNKRKSQSLSRSKSRLIIGLEQQEIVKIGFIHVVFPSTQQISRILNDIMIDASLEAKYRTQQVLRITISELSAQRGRIRERMVQFGKGSHAQFFSLGGIITARSRNATT